MMKVTFETDGTDRPRMASLDDILDLIIDSETETQEKSYFDFVKAHDVAILKKLKKYTMEIKDMDFSSLDDVQMGDAIEETASEVIDAVTAAYLDCIKHGLKFGIRLLFDLMA